MKEIKEVWKDINGYEGLYRISNYGNVLSLPKIVDKGKWGIVNFPMKLLMPISSEYLYVNLYKNKKHRKTAIHILVAYHFIENPLNKPQVNHKDTNKLNAHVSNLEWVTPSENAIHALKNNLLTIPKGVKNGMSKLTDESIAFIRGDGISVRCKILAEKFGVTAKHISRVKNKGRWIHV